MALPIKRSNLYECDAISAITVFRSLLLRATCFTSISAACFQILRIVGEDPRADPPNKRKDERRTLERRAYRA